MILDRIHVPVATSLQAALYVLSEQANAKGRGDLAAECLAAAGKLPNVPVTYELVARDLLVAALQQARDRGESEHVEALENLIRALKDGNRRVIKAHMNYSVGQSPAEVMAAAEDAGRRLIRKLGG